jgi:hypothetical protein
MRREIPAHCKGVNPARFLNHGPVIGVTIRLAATYTSGLFTCAIRQTSLLEQAGDMREWRAPQIGIWGVFLCPGRITRSDRLRFLLQPQPTRPRHRQDSPNHGRGSLELLKDVWGSRRNSLRPINPTQPPGIGTDAILQTFSGYTAAQLPSHSFQKRGFLRIS